MVGGCRILDWGCILDWGMVGILDLGCIQVEGLELGRYMPMLRAYQQRHPAARIIYDAVARCEAGDDAPVAQRAALHRRKRQPGCEQ